MTSVSGVRGIFGDSLDPAVALRYAAKFGELIKSGVNKPHIVIGRDSRTTGVTVLSAVVSALLGVGCDVTDIGIVPTPTVLLMVKQLNADGGIAITASHNPPEWNAMKFVDGDGMFLPPERASQFLGSIDQDVVWCDWKNIGSLSSRPDAIDSHLDAVLSIPYLNVQSIHKNKFKVVIDSVNGAGGLISPILLRELGCEVIEINSTPNGLFAHPAEPLNHNLGQLENAVALHKADIGFATDPDVDRLSIVANDGKCIGEELSVVLAELFVLPKQPGDIVVNLSTSMLSDDIAHRFGVKVHRTKVGEINVGKKMQELRSPIGGEGNGGIICPEVNYTRDAISGMALILGLLAESGKTVTEIVSELPRYYFAKDKLILTSEAMDAAMQKIPTLFSGMEIDSQDGFKIIGDKHWIHIRKSGTEPIIRVYVESDSPDKSAQICKDTIAKLATKQ